MTSRLSDYAAENFLKAAKLAHTVHNNRGSVAGMATLGDELFVVRHGYQTIEVYKPDTGGTNVQRNLIISTGSYTFRGLAACDFNQCLYLSEQNTQIIHKVSPVSHNTVKRWSVNGQPFGLSVNSAHNLLVACYNTHKVQEFTTDGALVREIDLQPDITNPVHVVQLAEDEFAITHHGSMHRYCVVGSDGKIIKSIGGPAGAAADQMNAPYGFAKVGGKVFVADCGNNRLLLLKSKPLSTEQLPAMFDLELSGPYSICFNASAGVMYVGEWNGGRIMCFQK